MWSEKHSGTGLKRLGRTVAALCLLFYLSTPSALAKSQCDSPNNNSVDTLFHDLVAAQNGLVESTVREQLEEYLSSANGNPHVDQGGWFTFIQESLKNLNFDGLLDRFIETEQVIDAVKSGRSPSRLGLKTNDYRLRNVAEMTAVLEEIEGQVERPTAASLQAANRWFYVLFGNNGGSFEDVDLERYREIARMPGSQGAKHLPQFEEKLFSRSEDPATRRFGNSLPAEQRLNLFLLHNRFLVAK